MGALFNNNNYNKSPHTANNCFVMRAMQKKRLNLSLKCTSDYIRNVNAGSQTNIHTGYAIICDYIHIIYAYIYMHVCMYLNLFFDAFVVSWVFLFRNFAASIYICIFKYLYIHIYLHVCMYYIPVYL